MADTRQVPAGELQKFEREGFAEYIRETGFKSYMGTEETSCIMLFDDLEADGRSLTVPLTRPLKGRGFGIGVMAGNEEAISNTTMRIMPVWLRNSVAVIKSFAKAAALNLYKVQRTKIKEWRKRNLKYSILAAFTAVGFDPTRWDETLVREEYIPYGEATVAQRNAFMVANPDRVLFGNAEALQVGGNYAASLANVTAAMTPNRAMVDTLKALAMRESATDVNVNAIRPVAIDENGVEKFLWFMGTRAFNRFKLDMESVNLAGLPRESQSKNIVFAGGIQEYNNAWVIEVPEFDTANGNGFTTSSLLGPVGNAGATVAATYFCGAGALAIGWGQYPIFTKDANDDYGFLTKVGTEEQRCVTKVMFDGRMNGMVMAHVAI
jgi:hypothetical protein